MKNKGLIYFLAIFAFANFVNCNRNEKSNSNDNNDSIIVWKNYKIVGGITIYPLDTTPDKSKIYILNNVIFFYNNDTLDFVDKLLPTSSKIKDNFHYELKKWRGFYISIDKNDSILIYDPCKADGGEKKWYKKVKVKNNLLPNPIK